MRLPVGDQHGIGAQAVQDRARQAVLKAQLHPGLPAGEHAEDLPGVGAHVLRLEGLPALARLPGEGDVRHLVHPVMLQDAAPGVVGQQVVVLALPDQGEGAHLVELPLPAVLALPLGGVLEVMEADLPVGGDGPVQLVHVVVDGLVHGLHPACDIDLSAEAPGLVAAGQALQLADESPGLSRRDELGGLDAVHQQLELRQLKASGRHEIAAAPALAAADDVHPRLPQGLDIRVNALALCLDALPGQQLHHPPGGERMLLVGLPQQDLPQRQELRLLIHRHASTSPFSSV